MRDKVKITDREKLIEGAVHAGDQAVIVDDVLTSGGSLLKAVAVARSAETRRHSCIGDCGPA